LSAHPGYKGVSVERGLTGATSGAAATYIALRHFEFDSAESFMAAFGPNAATLKRDMPNYTDTQPTIQISETMLTA